MLLEHAHKPRAFDPGHCQDCARETEVLDHYWHVQQQERALAEAHRWGRQARRCAICALWDPPASGSCWPPSPCWRA